jgi:Domain of unknown function (DUF4160)
LTVGVSGRCQQRVPHFHVFGGEFSAKFAIADCELLSSKGRIRRRDVRAVEQ